VHNKVEIQFHSELWSLTSSPTQSLGPPCLQIDVQDVSNHQFGWSAYFLKDKEITFPMPLAVWSTKIGVSHNRENKSDFQNLLGVVSPILGRWPMCRVGVC
jgi:hypothetical protein